MITYLIFEPKMRKPPIHKSFKNAFLGLLMMLKTERNFQIEVFAFVVNMFLIFYFHVTKIEAIFIFLVSTGVLVAEIFNTIIEKICDFIHPEFDKRIGFIKDVSAGAVLLLSISSIVIGFLIYWKYIFA